MKFESRSFSKRHPAIECALFVIHEQVNHLPYVEYQPGLGIPSPASLHLRGTAAAIILPDGRFWIGVCLCSPKDQFVKSVGRAKAVGRAYATMLKSKDESYTAFASLGAPEWIDDLKRMLRCQINEAKTRTVAS